jgi:hypothetical protein
MKSVLKEFGLLHNPKEKNLLTKLYEPVKRDRGVNMPKFQYPDAGQVAQADLLFLPNDNGYKYLLVVVDNGSRLLDAEPLKNKDAKSVINGFQMIFSRKIVEHPKAKLEVDAGSEFKAGVAKYFENSGTHVRVAETGRHRMQGLVERANQNLGTILHKRMTAQELLTGSVSREWVKDVPKLVAAINKYIKKREAKRKKKMTVTKIKTGEPQCADGSCELLSIGDKVRVALEFPKDVATGAKLHGKFRASDIRWDPKVRSIKEVLLQPNQPPLYLLDGNVGDRHIHPVAYTKNQLQLVGQNEKLPDPKVIRGKPKQWIAEEIVGKKKIKNKIHYEVKWFGFQSADNTWEPSSTLKKEVPNLVADYEKKN